MSLATIISSFVSGALGSMGLGGGTVLIIYLTYFKSMEQTKAQGINLICFIPTAILSVIIFSRQKLIDKKAVFPLVLFGIAGAISGFILLNFIPTAILGKLFGGFLVVMGLKELFFGK